MGVSLYHRPQAEAISLTTGTFSGNVSITGNSELRFYDDGNNYVGFEAPALTANNIWVLPNADGTNTQVLRTNGSGTLSWADAAAGAAGSMELDDTDASNVLAFDWSENASADYVLDFKVNAANRTITLYEDFTLGDGNDGTLTFTGASKTLSVEDDAVVSQDYSSDASPTFATPVVTGIVASGASLKIQDDAAQGVALFDSAASGETPALTISGFKAGDAKRTLSIAVGSVANDTATITGCSAYAFTGQLSATTYGSDGTVTDAELLFINSLSSNAQDQINGKAATSHAMSTHSDEDSYNIATSGSITSSGTGGLTSGSAANAGSLILYDGSDHAITIDVPAIAGSFALTLPTTDGGANEYLESDGSGNLSWVAAPAAASHAMSTHSDEDTYTISTSGDLTVNDATVDKLECNECFTFDAVQTATGDGTTTIDWGLGNVFYFTFGAQADTFTFTAPPGVARLTLFLKQDGTGGRTATWPGTVLWPGNVEPTLSTGAADVDIVTFIYDGTSYHGVANFDFS